VQDIGFSGQGCAICIASASMMTEAVIGRDAAEVQALQQRFRAVLTGQLEPEAAHLGKLSAWPACAATPAASSARCWAGTR
jgi:nitrogen fixation NifU-like protein